MQRKYIGPFLSLALIGFLSITGVLLSNKKLLSQKWLYRSKASETSQSALVATFMGQDNSYDRVSLFDGLVPNNIPDMRFRLDAMKDGLKVKLVEVDIDGDKGIYKGKCCEQDNWWELAYQDAEKKRPWAFAYVEGFGPTRSLFIDSYNSFAGNRTIDIKITYEDGTIQNTSLSNVTVIAVAEKTFPTAPDIERNDPKYASDPQPVDTGNYLIGMWYFPGWAWQRNKDTFDYWAHWEQYKDINPIDYLRRVPYNNPIKDLIRYPEEKPWVLDYHTKWAVEHGVGYWIFDWYWTSLYAEGAGCYGEETGTKYNQQVNHGIDSFLSSEYKDKIRFAVMMTNGIDDHCIADADKIVDLWHQKFFNKNNYLFVDGMPIVFFFSPPSANTSVSTQFIQRLNARAIANGYAGIFPVYTGVPENQAKDYKGASSYGYGGLGLPLNTQIGSFDDLASGYYLDKYGDNNFTPSQDRFWTIADEWLKANLSPNAKYIPSLTAGANWNMMWWKPPTTLNRTGQHPDSYKYQLIRSKEFLDNYSIATFNVRKLTSLDSEVKKLNVTYAWNEYGEGGIIHPTRGNGFDYLEAVREVFSTNQSAHSNTYIVDGNLKTDEVGAFQFPVLAEGSNVSTFRYGDGERGWEDYQVKIEVTPQFNSANSNSRFGINVWQTGQNYLSVYVKQSGIYVRAHNSISGDVGNEFTIYTFPQALPAGGKSYRFDIDMWKGRINVMWDGQFTKTLYLKEAGWPWNTANPWGGISSYSQGMGEVTYQSVKATSLSAYPVLYGPVNKQAGETITAGNDSWVNYRVDYAMTPVWGDDPNQHVGIKVRKSGDNYIWVFFRPSGLYWTYNTPGTPGYHELRTFKEFPVQSGRPYKVTIEARLKRLMVYVDGEIAGIIDDLAGITPEATYDKGGIETYGYHVNSPVIKQLLVRHIFDYGPTRTVIPVIPPTPTLTPYVAVTLTPTVIHFPTFSPTPTPQGSSRDAELICIKDFGDRASCETPLNCVRGDGRVTSSYCDTGKFCCTH